MSGVTVHLSSSQFISATNYTNLDECKGILGFDFLIFLISATNYPNLDECARILSFNSLEFVQFVTQQPASSAKSAVY